MARYRLFDPNDKDHLVRFWTIAKRQADRGIVAHEEYLYPSNIGLNPNKLKGLHGYTLAAELRAAADYLDELASYHEHADDAACEAALKAWKEDK